MYCKYCGKEISDDSRFCQYCGKSLTSDATTTSQEEKVDTKKVDPKVKKFKSSFSRAGFAALIWFGAMQVICNACVAIGYVIAAAIYFSINGAITIDLSAIRELTRLLSQEKYFIIVPIMYIIGYIISAVISIKIGSKLVYKNEDNLDVFERKIKKLSVKELLLVIACMFGCWGIGILIGNLPTFFYESAIYSVDAIFGNYSIIYILLAIIGAPIVEETIFRKLIIDKVAHHGEALAVLVSALLFGLMHGNLAQFFLAFFVGIVFGIVYIKTRNIFYTMGLHCLMNTFASIPEFFAMNGIDISVPWLIVEGAVTLIGIIIIIIFRKNELFKISKECDCDGINVHRSVGLEIFFIFILVSLIATQVIDIVLSLVFEEYVYCLVSLVPIGCFIAIMLLYNRQIHKTFKAKVCLELEDSCKVDLGYDALENNEVEESSVINEDEEKISQEQSDIEE